MTDWINLVWKTKPDVCIVVIGMTDYHDGYRDWIPKYVAAQAKLGKHIAYVSYDGLSTYDTVHPNIEGVPAAGGPPGPGREAHPRQAPRPVAGLSDPAGRS
jgi:hypothetical protein